MKRIVYLSQHAQPITAAELTSILNTARRKNLTSELTGILISHKTRFFQVLEGPPSELDRTYAKILKDPRHCNMQLIDACLVQERAFSNWRMGFWQPQELRPEQQSSLFSLMDLVPMNSPDRGRDNNVRLHVRDFLSSFNKLSA